MVEEYRARDAVGECFVHIRKRHSSNKDLSVLSRLTEGSKFYKVNLQGKEMESIVTNSARPASLIKEAECGTSKEVEEELEKEVRGSRWEKGQERIRTTYAGRGRGSNGLGSGQVRERIDAL